MTEPAHDSCPYAETTKKEYAKWAAVTFKVTEEGDATMLSGFCPQCHGAIEIWLFDEVVRDWFPRFRRGARRDVAPEPQGEPMICTCKLDHPDRPPGNEGCGAYWNMVLVAEEEPGAPQA
jgi:hypothetical protein